ncbi:MAG: LAGLIDADG family homing endonuclease [Candidatus Diapherotrites archaeon]
MDGNEYKEARFERPEETEIAFTTGKGEANPFIPKFEEFFSTLEYKKKIEKLAHEYPQERSLIVDFNDLDSFDYQLAEELMEHPDLLMEAAKLAVQKIEVSVLQLDSFTPNVRFRNLPKDKQSLVRDVSAAQLGKLISVEGVIRQVTEVMPKLKNATWRCRRCGNTYLIAQDGHQQRKPVLCSCKNRDFELVPEESRFVDYQKIQIQEPLEMLKGSEQAVNLDVYIEDDFVNKVYPGNRTQITGILRLYPPNKDKKNVYGRYLEAIHLEETEKEFEDIIIEEEEEQKIKELAKDPAIYQMLAQSIAPAIHGHDIVKESIALQLFGGVKKNIPGSTTIRGNVHVLLVGDPGTGKSQLLVAADRIAPKSVYVAGKTSSGVGLTASAVKDDFGEGGWTLKAGALVLASGGMVMVDEFDKMECLTGDSLVCTENGKLAPIQTIFEESKKHGRIETTAKGTSVRDIQNQFVLSMNAQLNIIKRRVVAAHEYPHDGRILQIRLQSGEKINVSPNHPFFTTTDKEVRTIKAGYLQKGSFILVPAALPNEESEDSNTSLARLYGYLAGDGNVTYNPPENYMIRFTNKDPDLLEDFNRCCTDVFSKPTIYPSEIREGGLSSTRVNGQSHVDHIAQHAPGLMEKYSDKYSPNIPFLSEDNAIHYLRGLFDSEGNVDIVHQQVSFSSTSERITMEVKTLLLKLGILSQIQYKKPHEKRRASYSLRITDSESIAKFSAKIGFTSTRKQGALMKFTPSSREHSVLNIIPHIGPLLKDIRTGLGLYQKECGLNAATYHNFESGQANITLKKARKVLEVFKAHHQTNLSPKIQQKIQYFEMLVNGNVLWRKVSEVKEVTHSPAHRISYQQTHQINHLLSTIGFPKIAQKNMKKQIPLIMEKLKTKQSRIHSLFMKIEWKEENIRDAIANESIPHSMIASDLGIHQSTISRWIGRQTTPHTFTPYDTIPILKKHLCKQNEQIKEVIPLLENAIATPKTRIYDLTIEGDHNFIANNIIVHNSEDRSAMHEAMEQGQVSVAKAGIVTRFKTDTSVLAAANPKLSRFDTYKPFFEQIDLPASLISRFDLFFMMRDTLDRGRDETIAHHILATHRAGEQLLQYQRGIKQRISKEVEDLKQSVLPIINTELLQKYISYARQKVFPMLTEEASLALQNFYVGLRDQGRQAGSYSATARQLEGLVRLAEASARVRLSEDVTIDDAERAIRLVRTSLEDVVKDPETGRIDIDIVTSGQTQSSRDHMRVITDIIKSKSKEMDKVPIQDVIAEALSRGIDEEKVREFIQKLKKAGEIYEPNHGFLKSA